MDADEGAGHGRVAGQEERPALLDEAGEAVAHGVDAQVGPVVAHAHHDRRRLPVTCRVPQSRQSVPLT